MTLGVISTVALKGQAEKLNSNIEQLELKQGDVIEASVVDLRCTSISITVDEGSDQKIIDLQVSKDLGLNVNDQIEVEVMKVSKDVLQLSIRKIEDKAIEIAESHDPVVDSINLDEVKKSIMTTNNPLQFSKQLDNHIEHAKAQVDTMLESFSDEEISVILKENYDVTKMTIDLLYQVGHSNRVDKKVALVGNEDRAVDISVNEEKINKLIEEYSENNILSKTNKEDIEEVIKGLINNEVKPEPKNVEKVINFINKVDKVKEMTTDEITRFLSSDKVSSVAELHKSLYVSKENVKKDVISENDYKEIEEDVKKIVKSSLKEVDSELITETLKIAKTLVKKGIPIDKRAIETIRYIKEPVELEEIIKTATDQIKRQEKPDKVLVTTISSGTEILKKEEVEDLTRLINKVSNEDVKAVVLKNRTVSFRELEIQVEDEIEVKTNNVEITKEVQQTIDRNTENLQILRYQMTYKAAMSLSIQGVDLKNSNLDVIRERIESFELLHVETSKEMPVKIEVEGVKSREVKVDIGETQSLSKKELAVLEVKKHMAIISASSTRSIATVAISSETKVVSLASISKASSVGADRYDELRTMPRKDLGDNIEKAFANVDDILIDLKLEASQPNQRAVEILGRNEMPITLENIEAVKELDIELQELFTKLMPEHVKEMVDQNINIMNEPIDKLVDYVRIQDSAVKQDVEEQVAKHIMTMLKNNEITSEQKDALVGIYRMIHTIESSKGAAVGFLLNNALEVNLENLFDAAKVIKASSKSDHVIDAQVNDTFGKLESINRESITIKEQIQSGYFEKEVSLNEFVSKVLSGSTQTSTVAGISELDTSIEANIQVSSEVAEILNEEVEKDLKVVKDIILKEEALEVKELLTVVSKMQRGQLRESLKQNIQPSLNELKAFESLSKNPEILKDVLTEFVNLNSEFDSLRGSIEDKISDFMNNLSPKGQLEFMEGVKEVIEEAKDYALKDFFDKQSIENSNISIKETTAFAGDKSVHQVSKDVESQLSLQKQLIDNEDYYSVPVMINGEMQHMSMYYFRQESDDLRPNDDMSVYFSFSTENIGTANIRVQLSGDDSNVTMYATEDVGNRQMKNYESEFKELFKEVGLSVTKLKYDSFILPTPVKPDQKISRANKVSKYNNNLFEKSI